MSENAGLRAHIREKILERLTSDGDRRFDALREYFAVAVPDMDYGVAGQVSSLVPPLLMELYEKWVAMFIDRMFETVPVEQVRVLCDGTRENTATLLLVYLMYIESATMEKQIDEDLREYGKKHSRDEDFGTVAGAYLRAQMAGLKN